MIAIRRRRPSRRGRATRWSHALRAARSLWLSSDSVNRGEFSSFARSLNLSDRYPGLQGIGWRTVVTDGRAAGFVARTRRVGEPTFTIKPPGRRPVYYVTVYSYPRIPFSSPLGADARTVPSIVTPLERARDTGQTTLSNQTTLPGDLDLPPDRRPVAFELFVPVYRGDESGDGVAERPAVPRLGHRAARQRRPDRAHHPGAAGGRHRVGHQRPARGAAVAAGPGRRPLPRGRPPGRAGCARPTCWPATAARSSRCSCPTAS
jgi:CHASE1-domain containing sensor protein